MTVETVRLNDLIRVHYGKALKKADRDGSGAHSVFGSNGKVGKHSERLVDYPTLVVGRKGSVGSVTYAPEGGWPIDTAFYVERLKPNVLDLRYLFYALGQCHLEDRVITTSIPGLSRDDIYSARIPLPPLSEQRRIAAILDKADAIRCKRQQTLDLADQFLRSAFLDMFGDPVANPKRWPLKKLGDLVGGPVRNGLSPSRQGKHPGQVLTLAAITGSRFLPDCKKSALFDIAPSQDKMVDSRDFLICRGNGNIGLVGRARFPDASMPGVLFPDTMIGFRLDTSVVAKAYLQLAWETNAVRGQIMMKSRTTSGIHKVNQETLKTVSFPLPPIEMQKKMEAIAAKIRDIKQKRTSAAANSLCDALIQRAFRGELSDVGYQPPLQVL